MVGRANLGFSSSACVCVRVGAGCFHLNIANPAAVSCRAADIECFFLPVVVFRHLRATHAEIRVSSIAKASAVSPQSKPVSWQ